MHKNDPLKFKIMVSVHRGRTRVIKTDSHVNLPDMNENNKTKKKIKPISSGSERGERVYIYDLLSCVISPTRNKRKNSNK